jgi:hypothetical protein
MGASSSASHALDLYAFQHRLNASFTADYRPIRYHREIRDTLEEPVRILGSFWMCPSGIDPIEVTGNRAGNIDHIESGLESCSGSSSG